jgi:glycosyltransferase involved in cell wall biosynthesis
MDTVFVNSEQYRQSWIERGFEPERLRILPRGLDTDLFNPGRRDASFWQRYEPAHDGVRLLYVGRISREKDLDLLANAYRRLREEKVGVSLFMVGHGPYAKALAEALPDVVFTGYLTGEELATAYASSDIFVFPSTTDTFGNVIIEAQASGVPVIVSDMGGPKELVEEGVDGLITKAHDLDAFTCAIRRLTNDAVARAAMGRKARERVVNRSWPGAFQKFWAATLA